MSKSWLLGLAATLSMAVSANAQVSFAPAQQYALGSTVSSTATADIDGDRDLDLVVADQAAGTIKVLLNNGTGTFGAPTAFAVGQGPFSLAVGDLDGDGDLDVAVAKFPVYFTSTDGLSVLLNNGDGTFAPAKSLVAPSSKSVLIGDLDNDGDLDIATSALGQYITTFPNNGDGTFAAPQKVPLLKNDVEIESLSAGDLDGDGDLDLVTADYFYYDRAISVILNKGDGTFAAAQSIGTPYSPLFATVADINGDKKLDIAALTTSGISVLLNTGNGGSGGPSFSETDISLVDSQESIATGDVNNDGFPDLVVTALGFPSTAGTASVFLNNKDGTFADPQSFAAGYGAVFTTAQGDLDGDGDLDLAVANAGFYQVPGSTSVLLNTSNIPATKVTIGKLTPGSGRVGAVISISGTGLTHTRGIFFRAATGFVRARFAALSDTQVDVVVPPGAVSGRLIVVGPRGRAISSAPFQVVNP